MDLMTKIRKNSATLHSAAEHSGFIKRIVDGNASKDSYAEYLFNLAAMYNSIEQALERNTNNETVKEFATPELYRYDLIKKDLDFLLGDKVSEIELLPSTIAFVDKINDLEKTNPELVIAYAYTRFIADLFGGRTFVALLSVNYKVPAEGLNYYSCDKIKDIRSYVMNYANKLNNLKLSSDLEIKFINEISNAYIYNLAISNELEAKLYLN
ncbi:MULTISPECIES: biliverdin-producing heme oxygenase [unclassified Romboutsia]|uniref:biliverdin-producing heme oxygenase n=1 Tax=unclassified Romboutsia TaxID=2626894 RepID=UPI0008209545|nr:MULTISPECIES: biliverdin-producing heme oxygenase [unclassified Romboutsia]SCH89694.1 Heme oxygenase 1 [uncultured Clostridium sp.]